jgi:hypothetical protein
MVVRKAKKDHPWRRGYQNMKPGVPNRGIAAPLINRKKGTFLMSLDRSLLRACILLIRV